MRYFRIFLLQCENTLQERGRAFVWFLTAVVSPLIIILFWKGAVGNKQIAPGWDFASLASYYFFLTIAFSLLVVHVENEVSFEDIKEGNLIAFLVKPFSYFWQKFIAEIPYRSLQAIYGIILCIIFFLIFGKQLFVLSTDITTILLSIIVIILAFFISFILKITMGITAFWFTDTRGFFEAMYATEFAMGGTLIPLALLPSFIAPFAYVLPFSYIIYFPIIAIQGKLGVFDLFHVIGMQIFWVCVLGLLYQIVWSRGIKKFSGVGQ